MKAKLDEVNEDSPRAFKFFYFRINKFKCSLTCVDETRFTVLAKITVTNIVEKNYGTGTTITGIYYATLGERLKKELKHLCSPQWRKRKSIYSKSRYF